MSKGDKPRPLSISYKEYSDRYEAIFGKKDDDHIPIESIAEKIDTTTYVLLTAIQGRTKRITI